MVIEGSGRRLPKWMAGASASIATDNTNQEYKNKKKKESKPASAEEEDENVGEPISDSFSPLTKPKTKTKRKDDDDGVVFIRSKVRKKRKPVTNEEYSDEPELTVEDLLTFAHEYVKLNNHHDSLTTSTNEHQHVASSSCAACVEKEVSLKLKMTGDPAQDMLHLLLGPLLPEKKPLPEEDAAIVTLTDDVLDSSDLTNQTQNNAAPPQHLLLPFKKKTSLKDKVSLLLN